MRTLFFAFLFVGACLLVGAVALAILRRRRSALAALVSGSLFLLLAVGATIAYDLDCQSTWDAGCKLTGVVGGRGGYDHVTPDPYGQVHLGG